MTLGQALKANLLGNAPSWYKLSILAFLIINPVIWFAIPNGHFIAGWVLIVEFIFTLAMALKCYPLPAGGLLAIEAVAMGMTSADSVYHEALHNFPVILLLIFMVAGIYFMKDLLQFTFTKLLVRIRSKIVISLLFCFAGAFLSAFLDALTVTAVIIAVAYGFYNVYHRWASGVDMHCSHDLCDDNTIKMNREDLIAFRAYLRNLMMHGAVGTALGGVCTIVGEPQNLLIGHEMGWHFMDFFIMVAPISMPVLISGLLTCVLLERFSLFGYGARMPGNVRSILMEQSARDEEKRGIRGRAKLLIQALTGVWLVIALGLHLAEVGVIGLSVIVILTACNGFIEEHQLGKAFEEALPFTALLVVFFAIVAVIHDNHLFAPVIHLVLSMKGQAQLAAYYLANGLLSMISDNVFVATVYISETKMHFVNVLAAMPGVEDATALMAKLTNPELVRADVIATLPEGIRGTVATTMTQFDHLAVAINTGTNIPSVATPNGQAAFLFLLTSALAPVIRLSYGRMVLLALPYTIILSIVGLLATWHMEDIMHFMGY